MMHDASFFADNRGKLAKKLEGGLVVVTANSEMQRRADMSHAFEQEANFWYLSGIEVSRWKLIHDGIRHHTWLVRPSISEIERVFDGESDAEILRQLAGADEIVDEADMEQLLRQLKRTHSTVYTVKPEAADKYRFVQNPAKKQLNRILERIFPAVVDCSKQIASQRTIKQPNEIKAIERAVRLTVNAFEAIHDQLQICQYEYQVEAIATGLFRQNAAVHAYDPIVGAGKNACTLHYVANRDRLRKKQLVLCDIGASYGGYAADITRTYAYGEVSKRASTVLDTLAQVQREIIRLIRPGVSFESYQQSTVDIMASALDSLGLTDDTPQELVARYMPHAVSHGLGIDVHDAIAGYREFAPGMVLTVEPGIYVPSEAIGTRIEDDILVTDTGHRVLSSKLASNPS